LLEPNIIFLNHGSFGACPIPVLEKQAFYRTMLEKEPVRFFLREFEELYYSALQELANFISVNVENIVFIPNATNGINAVLKSLHFTAEDDILTTNHAYPACKNLLHFIAQKTGAKVNIAPIDLPIHNSQEIVEAIIAKITPKTKIALIDHITSPTGITFPVEQIVKKLSSFGIDTLIDGAHAPGSIKLSVETIGAAYYVGNCHKWLCAPKGSAFLYIHPDKQENIHPTTISHAYISHAMNPYSRFQSEFYWTGTNDFSAYLCVPESIKFMGNLLSGGWEQLMKRNSDLVIFARKAFCKILNIEPGCPDNMIASMCSFQISDGNENGPFPHNYVDPLQTRLFNCYNIEVPIISWPYPPKRLLRISAQIYNTSEQFEYLATALEKNR
ncbi:MAG: penicillin epimerase, partial [Candidatus Fischerbacteria bacterium RBG_13_37_8]